MRHFDEAALSDHLRSALWSRSVIDQALGIIIGAQHCDEREAFEILRAQSQNQNVRIRDVATELVNRTSRPPQTS